MWLILAMSPGLGCCQVSLQTHSQNISQGKVPLQMAHHIYYVLMFYLVNSEDTVSLSLFSRLNTIITELPILLFQRDGPQGQFRALPCTHCAIVYIQAHSLSGILSLCKIAL